LGEEENSDEPSFFGRSGDRIEGKKRMLLYVLKNKAPVGRETGCFRGKSHIVICVNLEESL
jgi:hypothetical protein